MNNGISKEVISQFDKISELPDCWDHNQQYQKHLLSKINTTQGVVQRAFFKSHLLVDMRTASAL